MRRLLLLEILCLLFFITYTAGTLGQSAPEEGKEEEETEAEVEVEEEDTNAPEQVHLSLGSK